MKRLKLWHKYWLQVLKKMERMKESKFCFSFEWRERERERERESEWVSRREGERDQVIDLSNSQVEP
jgi:hypothetical protein